MAPLLKNILTSGIKKQAAKVPLKPFFDKEPSITSMNTPDSRICLEGIETFKNKADKRKSRLGTSKYLSPKIQISESDKTAVLKAGHLLWSSPDYEHKKYTPSKYVNLQDGFINIFESIDHVDNDPIVCISVANARISLNPNRKQLQIVVIENDELHYFESPSQDLKDLEAWRDAVKDVARRWGLVQKEELEYDIANMRKQLGQLWEIGAEHGMTAKLTKRIDDVNKEIQIKDSLMADIIALQDDLMNEIIATARLQQSNMPSMASLSSLSADSISISSCADKLNDYKIGNSQSNLLMNGNSQDISSEEDDESIALQSPLKEEKISDFVKDQPINITPISEQLSFLKPEKFAFSSQSSDTPRSSKMHKPFIAILSNPNSVQLELKKEPEPTPTLEIANIPNAINEIFENTIMGVIDSVIKPSISAFQLSAGNSKSVELDTISTSSSPESHIQILKNNISFNAKNNLAPMELPSGENGQNEHSLEGSQSISTPQFDSFVKDDIILASPSIPNSSILERVVSPDIEDSKILESKVVELNQIADDGSKDNDDISNEKTNVGILSAYKKELFDTDINLNQTLEIKGGNEMINGGSEMSKNDSISELNPNIQNKGENPALTDMKPEIKLAIEAQNLESITRLSRSGDFDLKNSQIESKCIVESPEDEKNIPLHTIINTDTPKSQSICCIQHSLSNPLLYKERDSSSSEPIKENNTSNPSSSEPQEVKKDADMKLQENTPMVCNPGVSKESPSNYSDHNSSADQISSNLSYENKISVAHRSNQSFFPEPGSLPNEKQKSGSSENLTSRKILENIPQRAAPVLLKKGSKVSISSSINLVSTPAIKAPSSSSISQGLPQKAASTSLSNSSIAHSAPVLVKKASIISIESKRETFAGVVSETEVNSEVSKNAEATSIANENAVALKNGTERLLDNSHLKPSIDNTIEVAKALVETGSTNDLSSLPVENPSYNEKLLISLKNDANIIPNKDNLVKIAGDSGSKKPVSFGSEDHDMSDKREEQQSNNLDTVLAISSAIKKDPKSEILTDVVANHISVLGDVPHQNSSAADVPILDTKHSSIPAKVKIISNPAPILKPKTMGESQKPTTSIPAPTLQIAQKAPLLKKVQQGFENGGETQTKTSVLEPKLSHDSKPIIGSGPVSAPAPILNTAFKAPLLKKEPVTLPATADVDSSKSATVPLDLSNGGNLNAGISPKTAPILQNLNKAPVLKKESSYSSINSREGNEHASSNSAAPILQNLNKAPVLKKESSSSNENSPEGNEHAASNSAAPILQNLNKAPVLKKESSYSSINPREGNEHSASNSAAPILQNLNKAPVLKKESFSPNTNPREVNSQVAEPRNSPAPILQNLNKAPVLKRESQSDSANRRDKIAVEANSVATPILQNIGKAPILRKVATSSNDNAGSGSEPPIQPIKGLSEAPLLKNKDSNMIEANEELIQLDKRMSNAPKIENAVNGTETGHLNNRVSGAAPILKVKAPVLRKDESKAAHNSEGNTNENSNLKPSKIIEAPILKVKAPILPSTNPAEPSIKTAAPVLKLGKAPELKRISKTPLQENTNTNQENVKSQDEAKEQKTLN